MADAAVNAGRGVVYIALAKLYFMIAGYVIYFILPRVLGSEVLWGNYLLVIGLVSVIDNVIVTATIQAISKFTAESEVYVDAVKRAGLTIHCFLGAGLTLTYIAIAPLVARWERDESLTRLYQLSAGIMLCYAFYSVFVGSLNGQRLFGKQAALDSSFATLRAALILGFALLGWGVWGAVSGFVVAAAIIFVAALLWVKLPARGAPAYELNKVLLFMLKLFAYTGAMNLLMRVDLFLLKRYAAVLAHEATAEARASVASVFAGYYGTAQTLAFIPYQAILAVAFVIFPLISRSTFEKDLSTTHAYIRQTLRLSFIFVAGVAVVFFANPEAVINVVYPEKYRIGGEALRFLALGMVCFSMFTILCTILNGAGHTRPTILLAIATLGCAALANSYFVPRAPSLEQAMIIAALSTSGAMCLGLIASLIVLYRKFTVGIPVSTVVRVLAAMAVASLVGHFTPEVVTFSAVTKLITIAECFLILSVYFIALLLLREFTADDAQKVGKVLRRGR